ncbi:hypothetical protein ACLKA7_015034 [Drosophila subpalustris]
MRNGIPGVLIEGYSASVSLLVAIGTCCGAGAAQVQSSIALGHLSPMLFNNKDTNITNTTKTKTNAEFIRRKNCSDKKKLEKKQDPFEWTQAHPPCLRRNHSSPP